MNNTKVTLNSILKIASVLGAAIGLATWFWQLHLGHEYWGWSSFFKIPLFMTFGAIFSPAIIIFCSAILAGILELIDPNEQWPHD